MNKQYIMTLLDSTVKTVSVVFTKGHNMEHTYMTRLKLDAGDVVVVPVGNNGDITFRTALVTKIHTIPDIDEHDAVVYRFIVQKVCFDQYYKDEAACEKAETMLRDHMRAKHRKQALSSLGITEDEAIKLCNEFSLEPIDSDN